jgi:hypothetical protein
MSLRGAGFGIYFTAAIGVLLAMAGAAQPAVAQSGVLNAVHTIAAPTTGVPIEHTFTIPATGNYTVTLTDLGALLSPSAPLASLKLAVTSADKIVGAPLVGAGQLPLSSLAPGDYVLHVVGMPGNTPGSGPIGIQVLAADMTQVAAYQDVIALPSQGLPNGEAVLDDSFSVSTNDTYTVTLNDLALPQTLPAGNLTLVLLAEGSGSPLVTLSNTGSLTAQVSLTTGITYRILAVGAAGAAVSAGLFSAVVTEGSAPGGTLTYGRAVPVGQTTRVASPGLKAGNTTLSLSDLQYPAAFTQLGAVLALHGTMAAQLTGAGPPQPFVAVTDTYDAFAFGAAGASPGIYALAVMLSGGPTELAVARGVVPSGSALTAYAFDTTLANGGMQTVNLVDFQFPATLASLSLGAVQGATLLGSGTITEPANPANAATSFNITSGEGSLSLVAFAQPTGTSGGLFGLNVEPKGAANPVFEVTQAVGAAFTAHDLTISQGGAYSVTATDLDFPGKFGSFATIVTQGTSQFGSIYNGGTFNFTATPGHYFLNVIAEPEGSDQAGTYALAVATAPAAPTVMLSSDHSQVSSGSTVDLTWSSKNATSCAASGGWSGAKPTSGTTTTAALTANTTFKLTCTGPGGNASQSVNVTITTSSGGGGGAMSVELLLLFTVLVVRSALLRQRPFDL